MRKRKNIKKFQDGGPGGRPMHERFETLPRWAIKSGITMEQWVNMTEQEKDKAKRESRRPEGKFKSPVPAWAKEMGIDDKTWNSMSSLEQRKLELEYQLTTKDPFGPQGPQGIKGSDERHPITGKLVSEMNPFELEEYWMWKSKQRNPGVPEQPSGDIFMKRKGGTARGKFLKFGGKTGRKLL